MATYPIKMLSDENGQPFVPITSVDSIVTTTGESIQEQLSKKIEANNIIAGDNITLNKNGNNVTISSTGGGESMIEYSVEVEGSFPRGPLYDNDTEFIKLIKPGDFVKVKIIVVTQFDSTPQYYNVSAMAGWEDPTKIGSLTFIRLDGQARIYYYSVDDEGVHLMSSSSPVNGRDYSEEDKSSSIPIQQYVILQTWFDSKTNPTPKPKPTITQYTLGNNPNCYNSLSLVIVNTERYLDGEYLMIKDVYLMQFKPKINNDGSYVNNYYAILYNDRERLVYEVDDPNNRVVYYYKEDLSYEYKPSEGGEAIFYHGFEGTGSDDAVVLYNLQKGIHIFKNNYIHCRLTEDTPESTNYLCTTQDGKIYVVADIKNIVDNNLKDEVFIVYDSGSNNIHMTLQRQDMYQHFRTYLDPLTGATIYAPYVFLDLPKSSVVPTDNSQLVNKKYVDDNVSSCMDKSLSNIDTEGENKIIELIKNGSSEVLWVNNSPNSQFAAQNITLSSGEYVMYEVYYRYDNSTTNNLVNCEKAYQGEGLVLSCNGVRATNTPVRVRLCKYVDSTTLSFEDCYVGAPGTNDTNNNYLIPVKVIGYKRNDVTIDGGVNTVYSTQERMIGKWTDNKPLYQKTYEISLGSNTVAIFNIDVLPDHIHVNTAMSHISSETYTLPSNFYFSSEDYARTFCNPSTIYVQMGNTYSTKANKKSIVTIEYTKPDAISGRPEID